MTRRRNRQEDDYREQEYLDEEADYEEYASRSGARRRRNRQGGDEEDSQYREPREPYTPDSRYNNDAYGPYSGYGGGDAGDAYGGEPPEDDRYEDDFREKPRRRRRRKRHHPFRNFLIFLLVLILILFGAFWFLILRNLKRVNSYSVENSVKDSISEQAEEDSSGYTNIALFGVDSRTDDLLSGNNRSDTIMICSINNRTGDVKLVSVYRDTYLDIGSGELNKCNAAYSYGGPEQAISMLNRNLDLPITDFVTIGFQGLAGAIDSVGGIDLDITEQERGYINQYVHDMASELGTDGTEVSSSGTVHLTGIQAVAYCRIRYTGGGDFERTSRQRTVLSQLAGKAKQSGPVGLVRLVNSCSDGVATSLSNTEIIMLVLQAWRFSLADSTQGIPQQDQYGFATINGQSCVVPHTLDSNVRWLHSYLFDSSSYQPSDTVESISSSIAQYSY